MRKYVFLLFLYLPVWAQIEPCGFFEINDVPGFDSQDLQFAASRWHTSDQEADFNSDGANRVDDLIQMINCVNGLSHGLAGSYYGFHTGDDLAITYPDFSSLPDPVVVRATERLYHETGNWNPLMDSEMRENTAGLFEGYLFAPIDGVYEFSILGYRGIQLFIDNQWVTGFESDWVTSSPYTGQANLSYGLHPIRVEYFTADHAGSIVIQWKPPESEFSVLDQEYLYHETVDVPAYASTGLESLFEPASGTRTTSQTLSLSAYFMGPDSDIRAFSGGEELVLQDGVWSADLSLEPGLNAMDFQIVDSQGRSKEVTYYVYSDTETLNHNGLVASLYGEQFSATPIPNIDNLQPFAQVALPGAQIDDPMLGSVYTNNGVVCHLNGTLEIQQAGTYEFRITSTGLLKLNGHILCGLSGE
ncbi:MAG: hypothetical protein CSA81_07390, partial [Acidobacteria bacterium]